MVGLVNLIHSQYKSRISYGMDGIRILPIISFGTLPIIFPIPNFAQNGK